MELFRPPEYRKIKLEMPGELLDELDRLVEYARTLGTWEAQNATRDNVLEYIVEMHLRSNRSESVSFRKWMTRARKADVQNGQKTADS